MKTIWGIVIISILIFGNCVNSHERKINQNRVDDSSESFNKAEKEIIEKIEKNLTERKEKQKKKNEYPRVYALTDTLDKSNAFVKFIQKKEGEEYTIEWGIDEKIWRGNFDEMVRNRNYREFPSIFWISEDYICLTTMWTGPFSEHLFLPLREALKIQFFEEDIEYMDSINQFVIYLEPRYEVEQINWTIQSLINDRKETFRIPIYENSRSYPWYESLEKEEDYIIIKPQGETDEILKIEIKEYST